MKVKIIHKEYIENKSYDEEGNELKNEQQEEYKSPYEITLDGDILNIKVSTKYHNKDVEFSTQFDLSNQDDKLLEVLLRDSMNGTELSCYEIFKFVDTITGTRNYSYNGDKICRVLIDKENNTCWIYLFLRTKDINGFKNVLQKTNISTTGMLQSVCPWFKQRCVDIERKRKLINEVDIYKSIAYLEAQVDLLTRLVIQYAPKSKLVELLEIADKYSVLNNKPDEDIKNEFEVSKADFRKKQEYYYERVQKTL